MMRRKRVYSDIDKSLYAALEAKSKKLRISKETFIELSLRSELERYTGIEEEITELRQQLTTAEAELKTACDQFSEEKTALTQQRDEFEKLLHEETDVCNRYDEQVKSMKKESDTFKANLKQIASHLGVPDTVKHCKQRIDELQASIEDKKRERNHFKAQAEEAQSKLNVCDTKLTLLLTRSWWERLWNTLPWIDA